MNKIKTIAYIFFLLLTSMLSASECIPEKKNPPRLVSDFANIISPQTEAQLEAYLVGFYDTTSTQIAIVTVNDLCNYDASSFAFKLGEDWGVGDAKFNNGVVILIKPKVGNSRGQAFIATGYGIEGVLPDAICKRIVELEMIPFFKQNDYDGGIANATKIVVDITGGEYSADNYKKGKKQKTSIIPFLIVLFFIFLMIVRVFSRAKKYGSRNNLGLWTALWLMGSGSGRHRGYYNDFNSGGGGFGGFGGGSGGFGGFGGGSFGGGGAGGSW